MVWKTLPSYEFMAFNDHLKTSKYESSSPMYLMLIKSISASFMSIIISFVAFSDCVSGKFWN